MKKAITRVLSLLLVTLLVFGMGIYALALNGDVNKDGEVTILDVMMILKAVTNGKSLENSDFNGDGKKNAGLVTYQIMTDEQLLAYKELVGSVDTSYFTTQVTNCNNYILTGECAILLVDSSFFEQLRGADRLRKLSEVFASVPTAAIDEYGIDFTKTALAKNSEQLSKLPEGTVLCLLRPYVVGNISGGETYSQTVNTFVQMAKD